MTRHPARAQWWAKGCEESDFLLGWASVFYGMNDVALLKGVGHLAMAWQPDGMRDRLLTPFQQQMHYIRWVDGRTQEDR